MNSITKFQNLKLFQFCVKTAVSSQPRINLTLKHGHLQSLNRVKWNLINSNTNYVTLAERQCWKCGRKNGKDRAETFFCKCGTIQEVPDDITYFDVLEMDEMFDIEPSVLADKLKALQRKLHPDKFAQSSDTEMALSADMSSIVNKAYQTLQKPLSRGLYLLGLHGFEIEEGTTEMDPIFLLEIMECNEAIIDAETEKDLKQLLEDNLVIFEKLIKEASTKFSAGDYKSAKEILAQAKYYDNILGKVKEKMGDLGIVS